MTQTEALLGRRILIVEDQILNVMMVEDILVDAGCEVVSARDKERALMLIEKEQFDAVILDVDLGGVNSYEVADRLVLQKVPFAFLTGYSANELLPAYGDLPVLPKPFSEETLKLAVQNLVASS